MQAFEQDLAPAGSLAWSAVLAAVPLLTLFLFLGVFRVRTHVASLVGLCAAAILAIVVWGMPIRQAISATAEGATYGVWPLLWILVNALWIYKLTEITGWLDHLRAGFQSVSTDQRVQVILIAFCFGALLEALAGFGAPVAITALMLVALGVSPIKSACAALIANTAPVAYGGLAVAVTTLSTVTNIPTDDLGAMIGRQTPIVAIMVPFVLLLIVDGKNGVRNAWPVALAGGLSFALAQFVAANYISVEITDIVAAIAGAAAVLLFLKFWKPADTANRREVSNDLAVGPSVDPPSDGAQNSPLVTADRRTVARPGVRDLAMSVVPYMIIVVLFSAVAIGPVKDWLALHGSVAFQWPGLDVRTPSGTPAGPMTFKFDHIKAAGSILFLAGVLTTIAYRVSPVRAIKAYGTTIVQLRWTIATVMCVLGISYVMNLSGMTQSLGTGLASVGQAYAFLAPVVGWIGVAVTGSDASSNSLFGALQVTAANNLGLNETLMASANASGGVLGKMISPQNLSVAAAAVGMAGMESTILRKVIGWSLLMLLAMIILVGLQSHILDWMVVK